MRLPTPASRRGFFGGSASAALKITPSTNEPSTATHHRGCQGTQLYLARYTFGLLCYLLLVHVILRLDDPTSQIDSRSGPSHSEGVPLPTLA